MARLFILNPARSFLFVNKHINGHQDTYAASKRHMTQVAGELRLACGWRVTPADVAAMRLRAALVEAEHKEEAAALLLERGASALSMGDMGGHSGQGGAALGSGLKCGNGGGAGGADGGALAGALPALRGRLDVKARRLCMRLPL
jgi:hypothetical protein